MRITRRRRTVGGRETRCVRSAGSCRTPGLGLGIAALLLAATLGAGSATAQQALALTGDTAPGTSGGTYAAFDELSLNASGDVAFWASVAGGSVGTGLFLETGTTSQAIVLPGDPAPPSDAFAAPYGPVLTDAGDVFFTSPLASDPSRAGLFRWSAGVVEAIALPGDPAPGSGGGTFSGVSGRSAANASGDVAFFAGIDGGNRLSGLFLSSGGVISPIVFLGEPSPAGLPGTVSFLFTTGLSMNALGEVSFPVTLYVSTFPATSYDAVLVHASGTVSAAAVAGDVPDGSPGAPYGLIRKESTSISDTGDVVFDARLAAPSNTEGIFVDRVGQSGETVSLAGDPAPGSSGGTFFDARLPSINAAGEVVFEADVLGGTNPVGIFRAYGDFILPVSLEGEPAPETGGGVFANYDGQPVVNAAGEVAFLGRMLGGAASRGVFVVPEPGFETALAVCALGLVFATGRSGRDHARRATTKRLRAFG